MKIELITTKDGSHSLYRPDLDEQYHSVFGAVQESMHIFITHGLEALQKENIQIFEVGFGTGLNVLLTYIKTIQPEKEVKYYSIEKFPLSFEIIRQLNYSSILSPESPGLFSDIHTSEWGKDIQFGRFTLHKVHADLLEYSIPSGNDLVYFDAFSPEKEPGLWSERIFSRIYDSMKAGGVFVTYSAKGEVRRRLLSVGFKVEKLPGPPGKKHILRAIK
jgi:tRNA U34 5-methylaminomethyl-2-thiouridine-forming methyltransferase MnmC